MERVDARRETFMHDREIGPSLRPQPNLCSPWSSSTRGLIRGVYRCRASALVPVLVLDCYIAEYVTMMVAQPQN